MKERKHLFPAKKAWLLDNFLRRFVQNPYRLLSPYLREGITFLDIGCGPGLFSIAAAEIVGKKGKVIAADLQQGMLDRLKKKISNRAIKKTIKLVKSSEDSINVKEKVDFILALYVVHETIDEKRFLKQLYKVMKKNSRLLIIEPKGEVSSEQFESYVYIAKKLGLREIIRQNKIFSREILLEKSK